MYFFVLFWADGLSATQRYCLLLLGNQLPHHAPFEQRYLDSLDVQKLYVRF
ncbi:MAG: hypothetical protein R2807_00955 [Chitinophagales bacterium]